jgi:hypothetical protein
MKISELPPDIREKALKYQRNEIDPAYCKESNLLQDAFNWEQTDEDFDYWLELCNIPAETFQDQNVLEVIESFKKRSEVGFKKYGTNTERTDIDLLGWLNHLQEELMDATIYIQRLKKEYENKN